MERVSYRERPKESLRERGRPGLGEIGSAGNAGLGFVGNGTVRSISGREDWIGDEGLGVKGRDC